TTVAALRPVAPRPPVKAHGRGPVGPPPAHSQGRVVRPGPGPRKSPQATPLAGAPVRRSQPEDAAGRKAAGGAVQGHRGLDQEGSPRSPRDTAGHPRRGTEILVVPAAPSVGAATGPPRGLDPESHRCVHPREA